MEVVHKSDYNTHAVIGGQAAQAFGVVQNAEFITVLSSTLYTDQPQAVVREVVCNAWDSHKASGITERPVDVTINNTHLIIRDYGAGIPPEKMGEIYCTYGKSTKKDSTNQTGGFGLGSKAPFAYTNHFTVTVHYNGTKSIWAISRGSEDTNGMPDARIIMQVPTDETGVEVSIPIIEAADVRLFTNILTKLVLFGGMNVALNGNVLETLGIEKKASNGFFLTNEDPLTSAGSIYVSYGDVIYPVAKNRAYEELYLEATDIIKKLDRKHNGNYEENLSTSYNCIFLAEPNTISITPSRESLSLSDRTIQTLRKTLQSFLDNFAEEKIAPLINKHLEKIVEKAGAQIDLVSYARTPFDVLEERDPLAFARQVVPEALPKSSRPNITNRDDYILRLVSNGMWGNRETVARKLMTQLFKIAQSKIPKNHLYAKAVREITRSQKNFKAHRFSSWSGRDASCRYHIWDWLPRQFRKHGLDLKQCLYWHTNQGYGDRVVSTRLMEMEADRQRIGHLSKMKIVLFGSRNQLLEAADSADEDELPGWDSGDAMPRLLYWNRLRSQKSRDEAKEKLTAMGFEVVDVDSWYQETFGTIPAEKVKAEPKKYIKKKGVVSLVNLVETGREFSCRRHFYMADSLKVLNEAPEFIFTMYQSNPNHYNGAKFFVNQDKLAQEFIERYGARGGIAVNTPQYEKWLSLGTKDGYEWLFQLMIDKIIGNKEYEYHKSIQAHIRKLPLAHSQYVRLRKASEVFAKILPEVPELDPEIRFLVALAESYDNRTHLGKAEKYQHLFTKVTDYLDKDFSEASDDPFPAIFHPKARERLGLLSYGDILIALEEGELTPADRIHWETVLMGTLFN